MKNILLIEIIFMVFLFSFVSIGGCPHIPPEITNEFPSDNTIDVSILQSTVNITIEHRDHLFNWTIEGTYITNTGADYEGNGSKSANTITPLPANTQIMWYLNLSDSNDTSSFPDYNLTYNFTTREQYEDEQTSIGRILLVGLLSLILLLGLLSYAIKLINEKTFNFANFISLFFIVIVIIISMSIFLLI